jgi:hypothetical protein
MFLLFSGLISVLHSAHLCSLSVFSFVYLFGQGCRSGFTTLPSVPLQEQPVVVLLLERAAVSWSLAMDEHDGHKDLCGSGCRSVISYVHRRTELYCSNLPCLFSAPEEWLLPKHFVAQGWAITMSPEARQVAPRWLKSYTAARVLMARSSK